MVAVGNAKYLSNIVIPETYNGKAVTGIAKSGFTGCDKLVSIEIPDSVTSIGDSAFGGCLSLTIYCEATSKPSGWNYYWNLDNRPVVWGYTAE